MKLEDALVYSSRALTGARGRTWLMLLAMAIGVVIATSNASATSCVHSPMVKRFKGERLGGESGPTL